MRTVAIYKSWVGVIDPAWRGMRSVYRDVLMAVDQKYIYNADETTPKSMKIEDALEGVLEWISRIAEKDLPWYQVVDKEVRHFYV
jgi:hypothetical protein